MGNQYLFVILSEGDSFWKGVPAYLIIQEINKGICEFQLR